MESLAAIEQRLDSADLEVRINALLDAWEYGTAGIELAIDALEDSAREVRQSALLLLSESEAKIVQQALWNYLPFARMQCLRTIAEFNLDCPNPHYAEFHHLTNFAIADFNDTLITYWILPKYSCLHVWDMKTGMSIEVLDSMTNHIALRLNGAEIVCNWYERLNVTKTSNLDEHDLGYKAVIETPCHEAFTVCRKETLVAIGLSNDIFSTKINNGIVVGVTRAVKVRSLKIINYETNNCCFHYSFEVLLATHFIFKGINEGHSWKDNISPLFFTPDDRTLIAHFIPNRLRSTVKLWDVKSGALIQTIENLPRLTITSVGVRPDETIIVCGIREEKVCAWKLQSDRIIYTVAEVSPCILSTDGRVLIYATANHEIVMRDLVADRELCRLQGHNAPVAFLALSEARQFLASYSTDRQIKIWGITNPS